MIEYNSNGIVTQNLNEILEERENSLKGVLGESFVIDKDTPIGNMELADANSELAIQELIAYLIPNMLDAEHAEGIFLDWICEKNRIYRRQPQYTTFKATILGTKDTEFFVGDIIIQDKESLIYYDLNEDCVIGEDGTVVAEFICENFGDYSPASDAKFTILTPISGLNNINFDYEKSGLLIGRFTETDEELRIRRRNSVGQTSTSTLESIKANISSLDGVLHTTYFENDTETTDSNGLPMKSFEMVVDGGNEDEITNVIFINKAVGTRAYGTTTITKTDSEGNVYSIGYTKTKNINIGIDIKVSTNVAQADSWKEAIYTDIKDKFDEIQGIGVNVKAYNYYTVLTKYSDITDIEYIKFYNVDDSPEDKKEQYEIGKKEIAKLDKSNIVITTGHE